MFLFISPDKNPYFNLASEELLFNKRDENFLLIYRNFPSVIIGKHQNPYIEADLIYLKTKNIMLARRLSGGGSVYHDEGNINFCFIQTVESEKKINFDNYTKQIISFLKYIGLNIEVNEKDDILLDNKKISGNAQHINKNRVLHHGTLLFSSDLDQLRKSLNPKNPDKYITHASKSVKSRVTNILCNDPKVKNIDNFQNMLEEFLTKKMELKKLNFSESEIIAIKKQVRQKYQTWEWIFGYSPHYSIDIKDKLHISVQKGIIENISFNIFNDVALNQNIKRSLYHVRHDIKTIDRIIGNILKENKKMKEKVMELLI